MTRPVMKRRRRNITTRPPSDSRRSRPTKATGAGETRARGGPSTTATSLLTRGPCCAEPPEAHAETVPVGKRTAPEVQEKVAPPRAGIRRTLPFPLRGRECGVPEGGGRVRYCLGVDWADQAHSV